MGRIISMLGMLIALLAAGVALGQTDPPQDQRGERMGPPPDRPMVPARQAVFPGRHSHPPMERMTPEERRKLRQDIHQHGRELYRLRREEKR